MPSKFFSDAFFVLFSKKEHKKYFIKKAGFRKETGFL